MHDRLIHLNHVIEAGNYDILDQQTDFPNVTAVREGVSTKGAARILRIRESQMRELLDRRLIETNMPNKREPFFLLSTIDEWFDQLAGNAPTVGYAQRDEFLLTRARPSYTGKISFDFMFHAISLLLQRKIRARGRLRSQSGLPSIVVGLPDILAAMNWTEPPDPIHEGFNALGFRLGCSRAVAKALVAQRRIDFQDRVDDEMVWVEEAAVQKFEARYISTKEVFCRSLWSPLDVLRMAREVRGYGPSRDNPVYLPRERAEFAFGLLTGPPKYDVEIPHLDFGQLNL